MSSADKVRVFVIEDDDVIRESFVHIVDQSNQFVVVGSFNSVEEALKKLGSKKPEIVLMDIKLPGVDGVEGTRMIKDQFPLIDIIIVSVFEDSDMVFKALRAGASGYLTKSSNYLELIAGLNQIRNGGAAISSNIAKMVIRSFHVNQQSPLTRREQEVLTHIAEGKTYTQISEHLFISKDTVKSHIRNIYEKLHVNRKSDAIKHAHLNRLI